MNSGTWYNKYYFTGDDSFWKLLDKDSKKQMLGTYDEYMRSMKKLKKTRSNRSEEEEGGEEYND